jgi:hypothetical protein
MDTLATSIEAMSKSSHIQGAHPGRRPVLLVDVDGVISLFGFRGGHPEGTWAMVEGLPHLLSAGTAERLARLAEAYELHWCTGWDQRANDHLPHLLGLPGPLPLVSLEGKAWRRTDADAAGEHLGHWKLRPIEEHTGPDRPVAWIDDDLDESCDAWAAARPGPTKLLRTDPAVGLTDAHVAELLEWARSL